MADSDGDGLAELLIGAPEHGTDDRPVAGATYFVSSADLAAADTADGVADGVIGLAHVSRQPGSWKFIGETAYDNAGARVGAVGDFDDDGHTDMVVTAPYWSAQGVGRIGAAYLVSAGDFAGADAADGVVDGIIAFSRISSGVNRVLGGRLVRELGDIGLADFNGDGKPDLLQAGTEYTNMKVAHLLSASPIVDDGLEFAEADIRLDAKIRDSGSYQIHAPDWPSPPLAIAMTAAGDIDADGLGDILLAVTPVARFNPTRLGAVYVIMGADLPHLDAADGLPDGKIFLSHVVRRRR